MPTLWTMICFSTSLQIFLTECFISNVSLKTENTPMNILQEKHLSKAQRRHGNLTDAVNRPREMSLRRILTSPPKMFTSLQSSVTLLRRTLRESDTVGHTFDMISDVTFREISRELSRRFWDIQFCNYPDKEITNTSALKYCLRCSCDDACDRTISCCTDIQSMTDTSYRYTRDNYTVCKTYEKVQGGSKKYEFVVKCPLIYANVGEQEKNNSLKCEELDNETTLKDWEMIPVSDMSTNTNYMNVYCAICHGVSPDILTFWPVSVECEAGQQNMPDSCTKYYLPPNEDITASTVCYQENEVITRCNVTGRWTEYDAFTEDACQHVRLLYRAVGIPRYQNIFCAICNGEFVQYFKYQPMFACPDLNYNAVLAGITTLLVYNQPPVVHSRLTTKCPPRMKYDPLLGGCNAAYCSWPLLLDEDSSCGVSAFVDKSMYTIPLTVTVSRPISFTDAILLYQFIIQDARAAGSKMTICKIEMFYKTSIQYSSLSFGSGTTSLPRFVITEVYVMITSFISTVIIKADDGKWHIQSFKHALSKLKTEIMSMGGDEVAPKLYIAYRDITTDPWFLQVGFHGTKSLYVGGLLNQLIPDAYDSSVILKPRLTVGNECLKESGKFRQMHDVAFISCPAFVYNLVDHGFVRHPGGLFLETANVQFEFGEFKSINESYVKICVNSITAKIQQSISIAYTLHSSSGMMILSIVVGLFLSLQ